MNTDNKIENDNGTAQFALEYIVKTLIESDPEINESGICKHNQIHSVCKECLEEENKMNARTDEMVQRILQNLKERNISPELFLDTFTQKLKNLGKQ